MSSSASPGPNSAWLDPALEMATIPARVTLDAPTLAAFSARVISEPLVTQRLVTASCVSIGDESKPRNEEPSGWGATLATCVASLLPACDSGAKAQRERRRLQEQILVAQREWPDLASGTATAFLICADHALPDYGLAPQLYPSGNPEGLLDLGGFGRLVNQLLQTVSPAMAPAWVKSSAGLHESLTTLIAETFKNTHDHAKTEANGSDVATSVRALYARFYPLTETVAAIEAINSGLHTQAERYVRSFVPPAPKPGVRVREVMALSGFLEFTVIDSGPGMVARWLKRDVSALACQAQADAVVACFNKGMSTTTAAGRGYGLYKVLKSLIHLKGLISIRTNGVHLYRSFGLVTGQNAGPGFHIEADGSTRPMERFYDWKRGHSFEPSPFSHVRGTVVSFLLPMGTG